MDVGAAELMQTAGLAFPLEVYFALPGAVAALGRIAVSVAYVSRVYWYLA